MRPVNKDETPRTQSRLPLQRLTLGGGARMTITYTAFQYTVAREGIICIHRGYKMDNEAGQRGLASRPVRSPETASER